MAKHSLRYALRLHCTAPVGPMANWFLSSFLVPERALQSLKIFCRVT